MKPKMQKSKRKSKKGKGKKGRGRKFGKDLTAVDKTFYELTITDLNNKLARLRSYIDKDKDTEWDLANRRKDQLEREQIAKIKLSQKNGIIRELEESLQTLENVRQEEVKASQHKVHQWEKKYKAMEEQLTSEIKYLNAKLHSLQNFDDERIALHMKIAEIEKQLREKSIAHLEIIHRLEQNAAIEKDRLKKDVEAKLLQLSEDFIKSTEVRLSVYTRRLICENVALNKEIDKMVQSQLRMEEENKNMKERFHEIESSNASSEAIKDRLIRTYQKHIEIIENLTKQYEALQCKYHKANHYKKLYENTMENYVGNAVKCMQSNKKLETLEHQVKRQKIDKQNMISMHKQHEMEIIRLHNILKQIKFLTQSVIRGELDDTSDPEFHAAQRKNFLTDLMTILSTYSDEVTIEPSVSTVSDGLSLDEEGHVRLTSKVLTSLLEQFKSKAKKAQKPQKYFASLIIPKERTLDNEMVMDVESDSTIIFSPNEKQSPKDILFEEKEILDVSSILSKKTHFGSEGTLLSKVSRTQEGIEDSIGDFGSDITLLSKVKRMNEFSEELIEISHEEFSKEEIDVDENEEDEPKAMSLLSFGKEEEVVKTSSTFGEFEVEEENAALFEAMIEADEEEHEADYFVY